MIRGRKIKATSAPEIISPIRAGHLRVSTKMPTRLRIKPNTVPEKKVSPPRAETGDPQPGLARASTPNALNPSPEKIKPSVPRMACGRAIGITGGAMGSGMGFPKVELQSAESESPAAGDQIQR